MHPAISVWPSLFFYDRKLLDGPELRDGSCRRAPWHSRPCFPPLAFFDCQCAPSERHCLNESIWSGSCSRLVCRDCTRLLSSGSTSSIETARCLCCKMPMRCVECRPPSSVWAFTPCLTQVQQALHLQHCLNWPYIAILQTCPSWQEDLGG